MTGKHTQGQWTNNHNGAIEAGDRVICRVLDGYTKDAIKESIANAKLIAASPLLLEALETTQSELISALNEGINKHFSEDMLRRWLKGVEEVIKRAKGEI